MTTTTESITNVSPFVNEPYKDYGDPANRQAMEEALELVRGRATQVQPLIIGGERITTLETFNSENPARAGSVMGIFSRAGRRELELAITAAAKAFLSWKWTPAEDRAGILFKAAQIMRRRRYELAATEILEVGKSWLEADADVAEAIDFLEFYGREMLRYAGPHPVVPYPGEENRIEYIPLGVGAIIPPWNFPGAILAGMTSAALVTGNTVVLKPSSDSPATAHVVVSILEEAGLPPGVLNLVTGSGAAIGDALVEDPRIRFISFTGSMEVGLRINQLAAKLQPGQIWIKRVVAEMGGKDATIVDKDADLDQAAQGIVTAAFGFQGQKCSACSRAIIVEKVYDQLLEKMVALADSLHIAPPEEGPNVTLGPVINRKAFDRIMGYIEKGRSEGRLIHGGQPAGEDGYFIQPTIIADVDRKATIAQEEIFGPVLAVIKARDFADALEIANDSVYGLTGAAYTRNPDRIEEAERRFHVGNLYINRKCTGALVGVQPFGGFNLSGTDSKAGGRDYLLIFLQAKSISRKIS